MTGLNLWTVYDHPSDYPEWFVARRFEGESPTTETILARDVETIRVLLTIKGLMPLERMEGDDPKIIEVWL
jgi:hypothetical protein